MQTTLDCIPCILRQTLSLIRLSEEDVSIHQSMLKDILRDIVIDQDLEESPPSIVSKIQKRIAEVTGVADPYLEAKGRFNRLALDLLPQLREKIKDSPNPLEAAMRLAVAGNVIDLGIKSGLSEGDVLRHIDEAFHQPVVGDFEEFRKAVESAEKILYLSDNTGEIAFDRLFLEQLPYQKITLATRGGPALNDALRADAESVGINELVEVIDTDAAVPGTILEQCSPAFCEHFRQADLIISKGQGNYETLNDTPANIFFLFKVKCALVASQTGHPLHTHLLLHKN